MRADGPLRDLDERFVPRLAAALRTGVDGAAAQRRRLQRGTGDLWRDLTSPSAPGREGPLRRLDQRFASSGPLALVRDVPQLGILVVMTVLLAGAGVALARSAPDASLERERAAQEQAIPPRLGPPVGADVEEHLASATARLADLNRQDPQVRHLALVSLEEYLTPAELLVVAGQLDVVRVYLRAPLEGVQAPELVAVETPLSALEATVTQVYARTAARKAEDQQELLQLARSIDPSSEEEAAFRELYEQQASASGREAAAYRAQCACVLALMVSAPVADLAELRALGAVRGVEVAARSAELAALTVSPLLPEVEGVVPPPTVPVGPQR